MMVASQESARPSRPSGIVRLGEGGAFSPPDSRGDGIPFPTEGETAGPAVAAIGKPSLRGAVHCPVSLAGGAIAAGLRRRKPGGPGEGGRVHMPEPDPRSAPPTYPENQSVIAQAESAKMSAAAASAERITWAEDGEDRHHYATFRS